MGAEWGASPDDRWWEQQATDFQRTGLTRLRETAGKWETSIGTLLGALGVVTFIKGPEALEDLNKEAAYWVGRYILVAAGLAVVALALAAVAAQGVPARFKRMDGRKYKAWYRGAAKNTYWFLWFSRVLAGFAVVVVFIAVGVAWFSPAPKAKAEGVNLIAVGPSQEPMCGELILEDGAVLSISVGEEEQRESVALSQVTNIVPVSGCPEADSGVGGAPGST
jgi:hypothetical protein